MASLITYLSHDWKHVAAVAADLERDTGLRLTLAQVRRAALNFPHVTLDPEKDMIRMIPDNETNQ